MDDKKKLLIEFYKKTNAHITESCGHLDISRQTFYNWCEADADFKSAVEEVNESVTDFYEKKLRELADGATYEALDVNGEIRTLKDKPSATAIIFHLKTKGKARGYVEKTEIEMNVAPVQVTLDKSDI
jgi:Rad3-related DNA helicase